MKSLVFVLFVLLLSYDAQAKIVKYELTITNATMNLSGKKNVDFALQVNGGIPAPTLEFTEGDQAEITVNNQLKDEEVSIHWHGILLPPEEDGVSYTNTPPIFAGKSRTFRFPIRQNGTYWYHSHTMLQEQKGVYGAIVIQPKKKIIQVDHEKVVIISDWTDENPDQVLKNLRKDGDYYLFKKNSIRSYGGAIQAGGLGNLLMNEWMRMGGMDLSDVGYDAFLINGKIDSQLLMAHPGEKVRLRIINAAASSYFYVSLAGLPFQVISADGIDVEPFLSKELLMGMAEVYDIVFTIPEHKNFELRATAQDVSGYASTWIGMGEKVFALDKKHPDPYAAMDHMGHSGHDMSAMSHDGAAMPMPMNHSAHMEDMSEMDHSSHKMAAADHAGHEKPKEDHSGHDMSQMDHSKHTNHDENINPVIDQTTVDSLKAKVDTSFSKDKKVLDVKLVLGGDMERYVWHINGKAIHQDRFLYINEGDVIRYTLENQTMMHHPMHLHGHFFRVLNESGEKSPLKHTVDVPPYATRTIEFLANEPGQWMLHCHNLYHMKTGMARIVRYSSWKPSAEIEKWEPYDHHLHDHWYTYGNVTATSNKAEAYLRFSQTWNEVDARIESKKDDEWKGEGDIFYHRWVGANFNGILGATSFDSEEYAVAGFGYVLPLLIESKWLINDDGDFRIDLEKRFQWTSTLYSLAEVIFREHHDSELSMSLMYQRTWDWSLGLSFTNDSAGAGLKYQF